MKIYTKKGDKGMTQLLGGSAINKNNLKLECYGTVDELNAFIGNIYDQKIEGSQKNTLLKIQNQLFNLGSCLACEANNNMYNLVNITQENIMMLEKEIDIMDASLPKLKNFILPSGMPTVSKCHIARTVCRRAERNLVALSEQEEINPLSMQYLNRLSDYLFVLARYILKENNIASIKWEKNQ